jgi:hypothetical protein
MAHPTTHNPVNFRPQDYEVTDYLDNRQPEYYLGLTVEAYAQIISRWEIDCKLAYGIDLDGKMPYRKMHKCAHCGNGSVRWIAVVEHIPTGELVTFGAICVGRLEFTDHKQFRLARIKARASATAVKVRAYKEREQTLKGSPALLAVVTDVENNEPWAGSFMRDIVAKLNKYGSLSERQIAAVTKARERDRERHQRKTTEPKAGPAPEGRVAVEGEIVSLKVREGDYGITQKMTVKLDNGSRVWSTFPSSLYDGKEARGRRVRFTATFTVSDRDKSFAFGKRPSKAAYL